MSRARLRARGAQRRRAAASARAAADAAAGLEREHGEITPSSRPCSLRRTRARRPCARIHRCHSRRTSRRRPRDRARRLVRGERRRRGRRGDRGRRFRARASGCGVRRGHRACQRRRRCAPPIARTAAAEANTRADKAGARAAAADADAGARAVTAARAGATPLAPSPPQLRPTRAPPTPPPQPTRAPQARLTKQWRALSKPTRVRRPLPPLATTPTRRPWSREELVDARGDATRALRAAEADAEHAAAKEAARAESENRLMRRRGDVSPVTRRRRE